MKNRKLLLILSLVLALTMSLGGTLAYLTDTDADVNTMVLGNVKILQNEQERDGKGGLKAFSDGQMMLPGVYGVVDGDYDSKEEVVVGDYTIKMRDQLKNYVDKIVTVTNTGNTKAYVRTLIAIPAGINVDKGAADVSDQWLHYNVVSATDSNKNNGWHWGTSKDKKEWPETNLFEDVDLFGDGKLYDVTVATNVNVIAPGETSGPNLVGLFLDNDVDFKDGKYYAKDKRAGADEGVTMEVWSGTDLKVYVLSQAVQADGFADAWTAFSNSFGDVTAKLAKTWFGELYDENGNLNEDMIDSPGSQNGTNDPLITPVQLPDAPEGAESITSLEGLEAAFTEGGTYVVTKPITVTKNLTVSANADIYTEDAANVITFDREANAKITLNAGIELGLHGVQMDGQGTFSWDENNEIVYDADARRTTPLLNVGAGATLTLDGGTHISNVVAKGSAVIYANGTDDNRAKVNLKDVTIDNCAGESGTIINVNKASDVVIEEGTVIANNASYNNNNHAIIRVYNAWDAENPSTVTMNGGEIKNNMYSGNGMIGLYYGKFVMNGGSIKGNSWFEDNQVNNGWYPIIYAHSNSVFEMNGGEISYNTVKYGAINSLNSSKEPAININGGTITKNLATNNSNKDAAFAVLSPNAVTPSLQVSDVAHVTGTVWQYYNEAGEYYGHYFELDDFLN